MTVFDGGCHCGNATLRFETPKAAADFQPRACQCSFCRAHGTRTASDPAGRLRLSVRDPALLGRYRFGLKTADYLVCRACGVYLGAIYRDPDGAWGLINTRALAQRDAFPPTETPTIHDTETEPARRQRRKTTWTPATIEPPTALD
jgi:hypothetical protein